ncbi:hypothetical protein B0H21DRAFT_818797 [Amylocystis lapponica]|nr:hypothetical protein B0H21DRAFT_818797 [Amylocystis lapponica]
MSHLATCRPSAISPARLSQPLPLLPLPPPHVQQPPPHVQHAPPHGQHYPSPSCTHHSKQSLHSQDKFHPPSHVLDSPSITSYRPIASTSPFNEAAITGLPPLSNLPFPSSHATTVTSISVFDSPPSVSDLPHHLPPPSVSNSLLVPSPALAPPPTLHHLPS